MDINKAIKILELLASGHSPATGEMINDESVLNERDVIRALQIAIDHLKTGGAEIRVDIEFPEDDIKNVFQLYKENEENPSVNSLVGFFLGTRKYINQNIVTNKLYGKFKNIYTKGQLLDYFTRYLLENRNEIDTKNFNNYRTVDFFQKEKFNKLSKEAINQLKDKINELGILKTENLSESVISSRKYHPRAYEHWSEKELELLAKAIKYTNDLDLLSECFQRGKGSIESCGQKIIHKSAISE